MDNRLECRGFCQVKDLPEEIARIYYIWKAKKERVSNG